MSTPDTDSKTSKRLQVGSVIKDRYRVDGFLGAGGFADVYRGEDTLIGRQVAIKILNIFASGASPAAQETTLKRFQQEAKAAALIKHPNAVTIYDFGSTEGGHPFMIMDLLVGHDLEDELDKNGPMTVERATGLMIRCLEALAEAHRSGIVHKDLKPSNLFLTHPGEDYEQLVILDFGIAGITKGPDARRLTQAGQVLGTPQYMAPEYIEYQTISPALDVYQMGLILVEMLTGHIVVDAPDLVTCIMTHTTGDLTIPSEIATGPLGEVIQKALARKPEDRTADADALRRALAKAVGQNTLSGITAPVPRPPQTDWEVTPAPSSNTGPTTQPPPFTPPQPQTPPPVTPAPMTSPQPQAPPAQTTGEDVGVGCLKALGFGAAFVTAVVVCAVLLVIVLFVLLIVWAASL